MAVGRGRSERLNTLTRKKKVAGICREASLSEERGNAHVPWKKMRRPESNNNAKEKH